MLKDIATIHLTMPATLRDQFLGTLRMHGITMQSFLTDVARLVVTDRNFLPMLEGMREDLTAMPATWPPPPQSRSSRASRVAREDAKASRDARNALARVGGAVK